MIDRTVKAFESTSIAHDVSGQLRACSGFDTSQYSHVDLFAWCSAKEEETVLLRFGILEDSGLSPVSRSRDT